MNETISAGPGNDRLSYGFEQTAVGTVLVAAGELGVAAILLGGDNARLVRDLAEAFPNAVLTPGLESHASTVRRVAAFIDDPCGELGVTLDIRGSADERMVWQALRAIPRGQVRSYGQVAAGLPVPLTPVQVGAACAANVLAVAIPCHRVVKADGSRSGYRWGVPRKRRLIMRERAA